MEYTEPALPQGAWDLPGEAAGHYERGACGEEDGEAAAAAEKSCIAQHPPRSPLRSALSSSEGDPEAFSAALQRDPSLSDEAGAGCSFHSAESGASLPYSTATGSEGGAGPSSDEVGCSGFSLAARLERRRPGGCRPRYEVVRELGPEEVRWFYREDGKTWKPFVGYDSLRIELAFRAARREAAAVEPVCVRGGLYEVDVANAECYPVYWNETEMIPVMRGQWFIDGTWQPLEEDESNLIEQEHLNRFKDQQLQDSFDMDVSKPVDRKEETEKIPAMRGHWSIDGTWQPLEEGESNLIEGEHLNRFKDQQLQDSFDMEASKPVDRKEETEKIPAMREQWFIDGTRQPLEEDESNLIEGEHLNRFKDQQLQDSFDMEVLKPVDRKEEAENIPAMRGQWSIDGTWQPLEEGESNLIEGEHLNRFKDQQLQDSFDMEASKPVDRKEAIHSLKLSRNHVDWHSVDEVYLYSDATTSKIARTVTQTLGFSKASSSGTRLHRGYVEEATLEDRPPETSHIVFVVHGIGQKMDQGRIIKNTAMMRDNARKIEEKYFSKLATHVEFLPVEWRSKLTLDGDTIELITPDKMRALRHILNSSALDIMYYTSPLYRDELVKGLQQELNRLYTLFCSRNPEFEEKGGKVSIVSHSLGCVITYDIMTGWNPVRLYEQLLQKEEEELEDSWMSYEDRCLLEGLYMTRQWLRETEERLCELTATTVSKPPVLKFKVENFFCMGSPLGMFLVLRGVRPGNSGSQDHILPRTICKRLLNIFHPADPVAYRLEPLILKHYSNILPVQIHWYSTVNPPPYEHMKPCFLNPTEEPTSFTDSESGSAVPSPTTSPVMARRHYGKSITNIGKCILGAANIGKGLGKMLFSRFGRSHTTTPQPLEAGKDGVKGDDKKAPTVGTPPLSHCSAGFLEAPVELEHRIDFELREGFVESRYWSAVTSHTAYWSSMDIALFLLTFMCKDDQEDADKSNLDTV
ncbi:phospholipase DDHD1 isoform X2 [Cuculus canorus]|uniref:phospholipase DDHD1 isoform X2 n=1 Tax=Cuculus canorus TaxID=55661 RepID=UPI0023AB55F4|nr:phospholipase DDHD1 isoform X2 [Cuculus canorus]